jgi:hypothetical protein
MKKCQMQPKKNKQAMVMKIIYEEQHKKQDFGDSHELTFKPKTNANMGSTIMSQKYLPRKRRVYHHTGKWEKSKFEDQEAWSC